MSSQNLNSAEKNSNIDKQGQNQNNDQAQTQNISLNNQLGIQNFQPQMFPYNRSYIPQQYRLNYQNTPSFKSDYQNTFQGLCSIGLLLTSSIEFLRLGHNIFNLSLSCSRWILNLLYIFSGIKMLKQLISKLSGQNHQFQQNSLQINQRNQFVMQYQQNNYQSFLSKILRNKKIMFGIQILSLICNFINNIYIFHLLRKLAAFCGYMLSKKLDKQLYEIEQILKEDEDEQQEDNLSSQSMGKSLQNIENEQSNENEMQKKNSITENQNSTIKEISYI